MLFLGNKPILRSLEQYLKPRCHLKLFKADVRPEGNLGIVTAFVPLPVNLESSQLAMIMNPNYWLFYWLLQKIQWQLTEASMCFP